MDVVKYLFEARADINKADSNDTTPVYVAAQNVRVIVNHHDLICIYIHDKYHCYCCRRCCYYKYDVMLNFIYLMNMK